MKLDFISNGNITQLGQQLLESNLNLAGSAINSSRDLLERGLDLNRDILLAGVGLIGRTRQQGEQLQSTLMEQSSSAEQGLQELVENGTQLMKSQLQEISSDLHAQRVNLGTNDIQSLDQPIRSLQELGFKLLSVHGRLINQVRGAGYPAAAESASDAS